MILTKTNLSSLFDINIIKINIVIFKFRNYHENERQYNYGIHLNSLFSNTMAKTFLCLNPIKLQLFLSHSTITNSVFCLL